MSVKGKKKVKSSFSKKIKRIVITISTLIILIFISVISYKIFYFLKDVQVKEVIIQGASPYVETEVRKKVSFIEDHRILDVNMRELKSYIDSLPWVHTSSIHRNLSGYLIISILEINPYLLWKKDNEYKLITSDNKISKVDLNFPLDKTITIESGIQALENSDEIRFLIYHDIDILERIDIIEYNGYRWNIVLKNGIIIKLPEENMDLAYKKVLSLNKKYNLLEKEIAYIDATSVNKLFVMPNNQ